MKTIASVALAFALVASPLAAQTMMVLLPSISFPDGTLNSSTSGCQTVDVATGLCLFGK